MIPTLLKWAYGTCSFGLHHKEHDLPSGERCSYLFRLKGRTNTRLLSFLLGCFELNEQGGSVKLSCYEKAGEPVESEWNIHQHTWRESEDVHSFENDLT